MVMEGYSTLPGVFWFSHFVSLGDRETGSNVRSGGSGQNRRETPTAKVQQTKHSRIPQRAA